MNNSTGKKEIDKETNHIEVSTREALRNGLFSTGLYEYGCGIVDQLKELMFANDGFASSRLTNLLYEVTPHLEGMLDDLDEMDGFTVEHLNNRLNVFSDSGLLAAQLLSEAWAEGIWGKHSNSRANADLLTGAANLILCLYGTMSLVKMDLLEEEQAEADAYAQQGGAQ
ncbi:hypothetical protein [Aeromonas sp. 6P]|uniref:hypothetical protein n=1 Tax=Aeromonas sp. 6P TaxID=3452722 RepID=UPI003F7A55B1